MRIGPVGPLVVGMVLGHLGLFDWLIGVIPAPIRLVLAGVGIVLVCANLVRWMRD